VISACLLASSDLIDHVSDHPYPWGQVELWGVKFTFMSTNIAAMLLVAALLCVVVIPLARLHGRKRTGVTAALEAIVVFVREMIAKPALHDRADEYLGYLLTLFMFILGMDLIGLVPLEPVTRAIPGMIPVGGGPTAVLTVCAGLALSTLVAIIVAGMRRQVIHYHEHRKWPKPLAVAASPVLWAKNLVPTIPGAAGQILFPFLLVIEVIGIVAKCFSLMVRLFANIVAGHVLLAVLLMFILQAAESWALAIVGPVCVGGAVLLSLLELFVAVLQAYIFTFLSAMFLGLYVESEH
jgi:F-type H+-transporting ATPase subunit a